MVVLEGPEDVRRGMVDPAVEERDNVPLREKNRRVDAERLGGGTKPEFGEDSGGELGPRSLFSRLRAV